MKDGIFVKDKDLTPNLLDRDLYVSRAFHLLMDGSFGPYAISKLEL